MRQARQASCETGTPTGNVWRIVAVAYVSRQTMPAFLPILTHRNRPARSVRGAAMRRGRNCVLAAKTGARQACHVDAALQINLIKETS